MLAETTIIRHHKIKKKTCRIASLSFVPLLALAWGCGRDRADSSRTNLGEFPTDSPTPLAENRLSEILSESSVICLENGDSCLIGDDYSKFIKRKGVFYVKSFNEILMFDGNGRFMRKIASVGNGPGEYDGIRDFDIVPAKDGDEVWICASKGIFRFDAKTAGFIARIDYKGYPNQLKYVNDSTMIVVSPGEKWINICYTDGRVRRQFLDKDLSIASRKIQQFTRVGNRILYQIEDSDMAATYDILTDSIGLEHVFSGATAFPTMDDYRSYHEQYGDFKFNGRIAEDFDRLSVVRASGDMYYALVSGKDGSNEIVVSNGSDSKRFHYNMNEGGRFNDLAPDVDVRFLFTPMATDSDDGFLFILEKDDDDDSNPCILDVRSLL